MTIQQPWDGARMPDLSGQCAVVTGANSGIGFETARGLASHGARVVLACRNRDRGEQALTDLQRTLPQAELLCLPLDLASLHSIHTFADLFQATGFALDILCNNAGIMMCPQAKTDDGFEQQFGTNHLGHFALTGLLLNALGRAANARVVTLSSTYHRSGKIDFANLNAEQGYNRTTAYQQSKLANLLFTFELQRKFSAHGWSAKSVAAHPGYAATGLQRHSWFMRLMKPVFAQSAAMGALPTLYAASATDVKGGDYFGPGGRFELQGFPTRVNASANALDTVVAANLWQQSEKLTGVTYEF